MNNVNNNNRGGRGPIKRRLSQDPRMRLQQNRLPQGGGGRFPVQGRGPPPQGHQNIQQQMPPGRGGGGRGFPMPPHQQHSKQQQLQQQHQHHHGRGGPPPMGRGMNGRGQPQPGRGALPMMTGGGRGPMHGRGPGHGPGQGRMPAMMGRGAPPPPRPPSSAMHQRAPFQNNNNSLYLHHHRMQPPPPPPGPVYGQQNHSNVNNIMGPRGAPGAPPPPPPRQQQYPQHPQLFLQQPQPPQPLVPHHQHNFSTSNNFPNPILQHPGGNMPMHMIQQNQQQQQPHGFPPTNPNAQFPPPGSGLPPQQPQQMQAMGMRPQGAAAFSNNMNPQQRHPQPPQQQQQQQQGATFAVVPTKTNLPTEYTKQQLDQAWSEHTNNGVKYYYNSLSKESTYTRPDVLDHSGQENTAKAVASTTAVAKPTRPTPWAEYTDATTGKKYYSNGVITTWEKPAEYVDPVAIVAKSMKEEASSAHQEPSNKKRKRSNSNNEKETPFRNNEEAVAAFKGLLLAKGVSPTNKWNEVVKICQTDHRWDEIEKVLTKGDLKQAMAEYQTRRANELRTQERQERARAKDAFLQLLTEVVPKQSTFSVWKSRYSDIRDSVAKDDRFYAVHDEATRESLFLDFCEELRKHDERKKRNKKREAQDAFCSFLKEKEEAGVLSFSSTWNTFMGSLDESDKEDSRFKVSSVMADSDRQLYFADFVIELQAAEDDKRRRIRDARRRAEKAQRDDYRETLERIASEAKISPTSHWRDVLRFIESDVSYIAVLEQDRDAPREIFEEFIDEWDEIYRRDRVFLSQLVHPSSNREILVTVDTKYDEFVKALLEEAETSPQTHAEARRITKSEEPVSSALVYFNELVVEAKEKNAAPLRRRGHGARRGSLHDSSSEDEGEIIEDAEAGNKLPDKTNPTPKEPDNGENGKNQDENGKNQDAVKSAAYTTSRLNESGSAEKSN